MILTPSLFNHTMLNLIQYINLCALFFLHRTIAFSAGKGFGKTPKNNSFVSFDRFRASCPEDTNAIKKYDASLIKEDALDDVWVAVYRSNNNLPNVFVRDAFFDAMKASTTVQDGDAETLVSTSTSLAGSGVVVSSGAEGKDKPVAVARLTKSAESKGISIIDSMRCTLKKEDTNPDCDGGSEHAEAIGVCIDELVIYFLQQCFQEKNMKFDGGIRFRGTLVSGKLLEERGFREVDVLSSDMHSHESDLLGALIKYAERTTSTAKNPGSRDRALKIVSSLGRLNKDEELDSSDEQSEADDFDPWASVKKYI